MTRSGGGILLRICMAAMAGAVAVTVVAGQVADGQQAVQEAEEPELEELDEVFVEGDHIRRRPSSYKELQKPITWMARLVGHFQIRGSVVLVAPEGREQSIAVQGRADCFGFGFAPGVQCELRVNWPGSTDPQWAQVPGAVSSFDPAVLLLGYEPVQSAVSYILVDNQGHASAAVGDMVSADTMRSRTDCAVSTLSAACDQVMRITARPDQQTVEMRIEQRIDLAPAVRYALVMNRLPGTESVVYGRKQGKNN